MISLDEAQAKGVVIGLGGESGVQYRREIDDLAVNDPDILNLILLALEKVQADEGGYKNQDKMGYFQVAGIHGLPTIAWDSVTGVGADGKPGGYCTHASWLFPAWHRPYLGMFEQMLYKAARDIASDFSDPKYKKAAEKVRLPYWDYFKPREKKQTSFPGVPNGDGTTSYHYDFRVPDVMCADVVFVYRPNKKDPTQEKVLVKMPRNPLQGYVFPGNDGNIPIKDWDNLDENDKKNKQFMFASRNRVVRHPTADPQKANWVSLNDTVNSQRMSMQINMMGLVETPPYNSYKDFSATAPRIKRIFDRDGNPVIDPNTGRQKFTIDGPSGSLEGLHNNYHVHIGGNGHMSRVPVAAFDPAFWLHHCLSLTSRGNVDRIFAIWQATPGHDSYLPKKQPNVFPTDDVPLYPFRTSKSATNETFWDSAGCRDTTALGYKYADAEGDAKNILKEFDARYRWSLSFPANQATDKEVLLTAPKNMTPVDVKKVAQVFGNTVTSTTISSLTSAPVSAMMAASHTFSSMKQTVLTPMINAMTISAEDSSSNVPIEQPSLDREFLKGNMESKKLIVQWYADLQVDSDAFDGAFTVFYFIGSPLTMARVDTNTADYSTAPILAGSTHIFTAPRAACDNCFIRSENRATLVTGTVAITPLLADYVKTGKINGLDPDYVVDFLKKNLYWRTVGINNVPKNPDEVSGLKVTISYTIQSFAPEGGVPTWEDGRVVSEITADHVAGNPTGHYDGNLDEVQFDVMRLRQ